MLVIASTSDFTVERLLPGQAITTLILAVYSVPVWLLIVREMDGVRWPWRILAHLTIGPLYAWVCLASLQVLIDGVVGAIAADAIQQNALWIFVSNLTVYGVQFGIYHTVRARQHVRFRRARADEYQQLAERQELSALKAQVNPHFLFNALNSISAQVTADPDEARTMIVKLSEMLRYSLNSSNRDLAPLGEELRFATSYLELEQNRYASRLRVEFDIEERALDVALPIMTIQPLVENAVRHGVAKSEEGGMVGVRAEYADGELHVEVVDTGIGSSEKPSALLEHGVGLSNTNARLIHHYGPDAALVISSESGEGFQVGFSIPISPPFSATQQSQRGRMEHSPA